MVKAELKHYAKIAGLGVFGAGLFVILFFVAAIIELVRAIEDTDA